MKNAVQPMTTKVIQVVPAATINDSKLNCSGAWDTFKSHERGESMNRRFVIVAIAVRRTSRLTESVVQHNARIPPTYTTTQRHFRAMSLEVVNSRF
jgi:hypothetical protein